MELTLAEVETDLWAHAFVEDPKLREEQDTYNPDFDKEMDEMEAEAEAEALARAAAAELPPEPRPQDPGDFETVFDDKWGS